MNIFKVKKLFSGPKDSSAQKALFSSNPFFSILSFLGNKQ